MDDTLIQDIRSQFGECSICMSEFDEKKCIPVLLQCQHSMCYKCFQSNRHGLTIVCPFCKVKFTITKTQITKTTIQKDRMRISLMELLQKYSLKANRCCECGSKLNICFCGNCSYHYCDNCVSIHEENCDFRIAFRNSMSGYCTKHNHIENPVTYYCSTCKAALCAMCAFNNHRGEEHDVNDLFLRYKSCLIEIQSMGSRLKGKVEETEGKQRSLELAIDEVTKTKCEVERLINERTELTVTEKENYRMRATESENNTLEDLKSWIAKCKEYSANVVECCNVIDSLRNDVIQTLSREMFIKQKVVELENVHFEHDLENSVNWMKLTQLKKDVQALLEEKAILEVSAITKTSEENIFPTDQAETLYKRSGKDFVGNRKKPYLTQESLHHLERDISFSYAIILQILAYFVLVILFPFTLPFLPFLGIDNVPIPKVKQRKKLQRRKKLNRLFPKRHRRSW